MRLRGAGLVEYAVPLALVGLVVGIGVYSLSAGGNLLDMFLGSSNSKYESSSKSAIVNEKTNVTPTVFSQNPNVPDPVIHPSGTTPTVTSSNCASGSCSIDFGSFTLTGIPENFSDYVATNASSGGTDKICDIFMQISDQLAAQGDAIGAAQYKDLANLGHFLAVQQKLVETIAENNKNVNPYLLNQAYENNANLPYLSSNVSHLLPKYNEFASMNMDPKIIMRYTLNDAQKQYIDGYKPVPDNPDANPSYSSFPQYAMIDIYNSILDNPSYSSDLKNITIALMKSLDDLSFNLTNNLEYATSGILPEIPRFDMVTGESVEYTFPKQNGLVSDHVSNITSPFTHLDSRLICALGGGKDPNNACNAN